MAKSATLEQAQKRATRVIEDLEWLGDYLEDAGFESEADRLDVAAEGVESVSNSLDAL